MIDLEMTIVRLDYYIDYSINNGEICFYLNILSNNIYILSYIFEYLPGYENVIKKTIDFLVKNYNSKIILTYCIDRKSVEKLPIWLQNYLVI